MGASRKTEIRWRALVREQESSGRSVQEFARGRGLSPATIYWWRSRLRREGSKRGEHMQLAPVTVLRSPTSARSGAESFEIELANGRRLRVPADFDGEALGRLLTTLERTC